jgi:hypothetical protein
MRCLPYWPHAGNTSGEVPAPFAAVAHAKNASVVKAFQRFGRMEVWLPVSRWASSSLGSA